MRLGTEVDEGRGETLLLVPFLAVLLGTLVYVFVVILPRVNVLPAVLR